MQRNKESRTLDRMREITRKSKRRECKICRKNKYKVSRNGFCKTCMEDKINLARLQIKQKSGEIYEKWKLKMGISLGLGQ